MKIFILHHHLKKGGVTRIIGLQVKSLLEIGFKKDNIKILCGHLPEDEKIDGVEVIVKPELDYLYRDSIEKIDLPTHLDKVSTALKSTITKEDIIHVHNFGLGKNPLFTIAISKMINDGYKVLNHCHDFAEDRPENMDYLEEIIKNYFGFRVTDILYPINSNIVYAVINQSDKERLFESGIPEDDIYYLPNPLDSKEFSQFINKKDELRTKICNKLNIDNKKTIITYPIRVIRRKNIEEILLLSILLQDEAVFLVTLPPENPVEIKYYKYWKNFSIQNNLPVIFDVSQSIDFRELLAGSDFCVSTSIREGFGMTFLEPWLTETPVIGRDLPFVTNDFKNSGIIFTSLYKNIIITEKENKDFKDLDQKEATELLLEIIEKTNSKLKILYDNPEIEELLNFISIDLVRKNKKIITENYSLSKYGKNLNDIYKRLSK